MTIGISSWLRMIRSASLLAQTLSASGTVIQRRSGTICDALADPLNADMVELQLMVTEKAAAFSAIGTALTRDWLKLQVEWMAQAATFGTMITAGSLPSLRTVHSLAARSTRLNDQSIASANRALRSIHAGVTANAIRLGKKRM